MILVIPLTLSGSDQPVNREELIQRYNAEAAYYEAQARLNISQIVYRLKEERK